MSFKSLCITNIDKDLAPAHLEFGFMPIWHVFYSIIIYKNVKICLLNRVGVYAHLANNDMAPAPRKRAE